MSGHPDHSAQLRAADRCVRSGRRDEAEAIFQNLLAADPRDGLTLLAWGQLRRAIGDAPAAAQLLQRAIAANAGPAALVEFAALLIDHANSRRRKICCARRWRRVRGWRRLTSSSGGRERRAGVLNSPWTSTAPPAAPTQA